MSWLDNVAGPNTIASLLLIIKDRLVHKEFKTGSNNEFKVLSDNNLSDNLKAKYNAAYDHSNEDHAPASAQANVIEGVLVNGNLVTPTNKIIPLSIPAVAKQINSTNPSDQDAASAKAVVAYVTEVLSNHKAFERKILKAGEYDEETRKPTISGSDSCIYLVPANDNATEYIEWLFIGDDFEPIGSTASVNLEGYVKEEDISEITAAQVETLWNQVFGE